MAWDDISDIPWLNSGEPAGAPALRGAQAGAAIASTWLRAREQREQRRQFDAQMALRQKQAEVENAARDANTAGQLLQNQEVENMLGDAVMFKASQAAFNAGDSTINPEFKTPQGAAAWLNWKNNTTVGKLKLADTTQFINALPALRPADRADIMSMQTNQDGSPSAAQLRAVSLIQERYAAEQQNKISQIEIDALERGDKVTTTVGPKGVTTTYAPPKPEDKPKDTTVTYDTPFPDMPWVKVAKSGTGAIHVIKGEAPLTNVERAKTLNSIAKAQSALATTPKESPSAKTLQSQIDVLNEALGETKEGAPKTSGGQPLRVTTKDQFDELPSGEIYIGKDGKQYRKP